jgi:hypothetical protein
MNRRPDLGCGGFEGIGVAGEFLGAVQGAADAFNFELAGGDLAGGFAMLAGPL